LRVVRRYAASRGINPERVQFVDGSGLSTADLIAPDDLTAFLVAVQREPWFQTWYAALPIAGEPEHLVGGTLASRMLGTAAAGNVHGKTGSLTTSSGLAGYVTTGVGERLVFSVVEEGFIGPPPRAVEDAFAVTLADAQAATSAFTSRRRPDVTS
jgi:D-alanyl-D-alanine carboxypeptidase/D-alanyl-D-alanine-endopeptidase (penicillin-binding protein 4)